MPITPQLMSGDTRKRVFYAKKPTKIHTDGRNYTVHKEWVEVIERYYDGGSYRWWAHVAGRVVPAPDPLPETVPWWKRLIRFFFFWRR